MVIRFSWQKWLKNNPSYMLRSWNLVWSFSTLLLHLLILIGSTLPIKTPLSASSDLLHNSLEQPLEPPTVFLSILARNKAHTLPQFLNCINLLEYNKKRITVYINTNNNQDTTESLLKEWVDAHKEEYKSIIFDSHHVQALDLQPSHETNPHLEESLDNIHPHHWDATRCKTLGQIRNKSLKIAHQEGCDYYFVIDCDNFIAPPTLKILVDKKKPIIAPMLKAFPERFDQYSNFFTDISQEGYFKKNSSYAQILYRQKVGTFEVPLVHCTYLVHKECLASLSYVDDSQDYEFIIFSRNARKQKIAQFICNEIDFGYLLHFTQNISLNEEKERLEKYFTRGSTY